MIIYRYLSGQLFVATASVGFILSIILISGRFLKYMSEAASGELEGWAVFAVLLFRLPEFITLILPLSLFLGVLLAYGRMYVEYEMTVLKASGVGQWSIIRFTIIPGLCMSLLVAFLALEVTPWGNEKSNKILVDQYTRSALELLTPGQFMTLEKGNVVYAETISLDKTQLQNVFTSTRVGNRYVSLVADTGRRVLDEKTGAQYMELSNGFRYESEPGSKSFDQIQFESYTFKLKGPSKNRKRKLIQSKSTKELLNSTKKDEVAELQWRLALGPLAFIIVLLAVPLSKANPRQGRFLSLIPGVLLYVSYMIILVFVKNAMEKGDIPVYPGFWAVHLLFLVIALVFIQWDSIRLKLFGT